MVIWSDALYITMLINITHFGGNWYCLIENRFLYIKCKERSIDCTSALMFVLSILRLSRNAIELQTVS